MIESVVLGRTRSAGGPREEGAPVSAYASPVDATQRAHVSRRMRRTGGCPHAPGSGGLLLRAGAGVDYAVLEERQRDLQRLAHPLAQLLVALHLLVRADRALFVLLGRGLRLRDLLAQLVALLAQQVLLAGQGGDLFARRGQLALALLRRGSERVGALLQRFGRGVALHRLLLQLLRLLLQRALLLLQVGELLRLVV